MPVSNRADEITYYEELGVGSRASAEEIRDAFRALARLLHPDQQTDIQLKNVAEAQMRKLNRIYAVLSDPDRRREYDELLDEDLAPPVQERFYLAPATKRTLNKVAWAAAIFCGAGLLIWFTAETSPSPQSRARDQNPPAQPPAAGSSALPKATRDQGSLIAGLRSDLKAVTAERDAAVRELSRLRGAEPAQQTDSAAAPETAEIRLPAITMTELPSPAKLPLPPGVPPPRTAKPAAPRLAGFWFYAKPANGQHNKNQALYPPEYIEATITEENGTIHGKYRARFQIVDRPISPDVNFTFTGASSNGSQATYSWTGGGGAKGELTLKFLSENSLRIDWNATELGTQQGLDAGTAVLTRRIE